MLFNYLCEIDKYTLLLLFVLVSFFLSNHVCAQGLKFQRYENSIENRTLYNDFAYKSRMFKDRLDVAIDYASAL